jgi:hypothetical protein
MSPDGRGDHDVSLLSCIAYDAVPLLVQRRKEDVVAFEYGRGVIAGGVAGTGGGDARKDAGESAGDGRFFRHVEDYGRSHSRAGS